MPDHNAEQEVPSCPVCGQDAVTLTKGSRWRKCRDCDASWNAEAQQDPFCTCGSGLVCGECMTAHRRRAERAHADVLARSIRAVIEALDGPITEAWTAFMDGPGGKTEALRQGKHESLVRARDLAVKAIRDLATPPTPPAPTVADRGTPTLRAEPYDPATDCSCPPPHRGDQAPNPECVEHGTSPGTPTQDEAI